MIHQTKIIKTFPHVHIPNKNGLPIEVSLIAQLGHGAGNHLFKNITSRQSHHTNFIDELDEPSAKLGDINLPLDDPSTLYSFAVGPKGHPFHSHAGHRVFTAISGSGGAQLRFSTATHAEIEKEPNKFIDELNFINIPPDCLFTVRFGGETWHQFYPLSKNTLHPVFVALSCHTNELGGSLPNDIKEKAITNNADIPTLTELLPAKVTKIIHSKEFQHIKIPTTTLSLDAAAGTAQRAVCDTFRGSMGILRTFLISWNQPNGYISKTVEKRDIQELKKSPHTSLLKDQLQDYEIHHEDTFLIKCSGNFKNTNAPEILETLLEGFLLNAPKNVSRLMMIRNIIVKPLGLRTSPLGCPVSSLLSDKVENLFANRYPVIDQKIKDQSAEIILGADDKHLKFRSCIAVNIINQETIEISMGTRVHCKNSFGKFYMAIIDYVHRKYISPKMLKLATDFALNQISNSR